MRLPIQIVAILFRKSNGKPQYLIAKRIPEKGGFWQPITGGLEEGETKIEALKREIREETGIKNIIRIIESVHYFEFSAGARRRCIINYHIVKTKESRTEQIREILNEIRRFKEGKTNRRKEWIVD